MYTNKITILDKEQPIYDIIIEESYDQLHSQLEQLQTSNRKLCIVTDTNTARLYQDKVVGICKQYASSVETFTIEAGEASKTLDTVTRLYEKLIQAQFDRSDLLVALGGGVVGDLCGYTAATYLRGIQFIQMPTSLLAMVDSSIGGKTGVDFNAYKNMVGAFHQPKCVYINLSCLKTLPAREFYSGFAEVIKYGLIMDAPFYSWLKEHSDELMNYDMEALRTMIYKSCISKKTIVEEDPKELGVRALLNLGHTIGHSVEKLKEFSLLHGECVSIGIAAAAFISYERDLLSSKEFNDIISTLKQYHLPTTVDGLDPFDVVDATKNDKKMLGNVIRFILLHGVGHAFIDKSVSYDDMIAAVSYVLR